MGRLLKFWSLTPRERRFLCEAAILLLLSNLCVRTIAFRHIYAFLHAHWNGASRNDSDRNHDIKLINLSISRAANLLPWKSLCLSRSITTFIMLRRRDIQAIMFAGVKFSEGSSLLAHAWVRTDHVIIDETSDNSEFTVVLRIGEESWSAAPGTQYIR
jgi:Transglutaminase-like superfamily